MSLIQENKTKLFYGYVIVAASFGIMTVLHGTFSTFGVFFNPLLAQFSTSRAALSAAASIASFTMAAAIVVGALADKFGPRVVLTICAVLFGLGYLLMSQVNALWQMYLLFVFIGIAQEGFI